MLRAAHRRRGARGSELARVALVSLVLHPHRPLKHHVHGQIGGALLDDSLSGPDIDLLGQGEQIKATHRLQFRKEIGKEGHGGRPLL